jgi:phosphoribosylformimino-5-aminoimidazole carboxamide ribotide isomerase
MTFEIIPAVDLMKGCVVRLYRGEASSAKIYHTNPLEAAQKWVDEGAETIHIIDLDAALGVGDNTQQIEEIAKKVKAKIQVGGGIRSIAKAERLIKSGVHRILIGTKAILDKQFTRELLSNYGAEHVAVALDYLQDEVLIEGWTKKSGLKLNTALDKMAEIGVQYILLTSKERDGTLSGPDYTTIREASKRRGLKIVAAGGIETIEQILALREAGAYACIVGRCLYEGTLNLRDAIKAVREVERGAR